MGLTFATDDGSATGTLRQSAALWSPGGFPRLSALATLADCVAGYRAVQDFEGAWLGTSELAAHGPFRPTHDDVVAVAELLRRRRSGAVYEVTVRSGPTAAPVAAATVTLALLSRQGERRIPTGAIRPADVPAPPLASIDDLLTLEHLDTETHLAVTDGIRNSWGVVAGGMLTMLVEAAAERSASSATGCDCRVESLGMHFLAPGRVGPLAARASVLSRPTTTGAVHLQVRVLDRGADDRLLATVSAVATTIGDGTV
jgi:acyl-coenzyme A thioesterase PaaI-like protein